ncbi:hypothetical protein ACM66B_002501 [Microbotryomycetes sp. NB124-2]
MSVAVNFSFGAPSTSQPAQGTSLFGSTPAAGQSTTPSLFGTQSISQPAAPGAGLFGSSSASKPPSFSFGAPGASATTTTSSAPSLFGGAATTAPLGGASLFGAPAQQQQQQPQPASLLGGFGTQSSSLSTLPPGSALTSSSKFNDLPDVARTVIEGIEAAVRSQIQLADELKPMTLGDSVQRVTLNAEQSSVEATAIVSLLAQDLRATAELRARLESDLEILSKVNTIIDGCMNPQSKGQAARSLAGFPHEYFSRKAAEFRERLLRYESALDTIEQQISSAGRSERSPQAIVPTLRAQHASFMALASAVAALDLQLKKVKDEYRSIWRAKTGSVQDPFRQVDRSGLRQSFAGVAIS